MLCLSFLLFGHSSGNEWNKKEAGKIAEQGARFLSHELITEVVHDIWGCRVVHWLKTLNRAWPMDKFVKTQIWHRLWINERTVCIVINITSSSSLMIHYFPSSSVIESKIFHFQHILAKCHRVLICMWARLSKHTFSWMCVTLRDSSCTIPKGHY